MTYTTLNDLKEWPKLYQLAVLRANEKNPHMRWPDDTSISSTFLFAATPEKYDFWRLIKIGNFDQARALRPELFEEAELTPCERLGYKVGDRFRVISDSLGYFKPGEIVYMIADDGDSIPKFCQEITSNRYHDKAGYLKLAEVEPLPDEQEEEEVMDRIIDERVEEESNRAMLARDGEEEMCNTQELWDNPMAKHTESLSRALSVDTVAITKFSPRGM